MDYKILEVNYLSPSIEVYKEVGDGYKSASAVWFALSNEIGKRIADGKMPIRIVLAKEENGIIVHMGRIILDDRSLEKIAADAQQTSLPF